MRVAVLGAGYAGLTAGLRLEASLPDGVELVVVNDTPDHLVRHELHRVIRRPGFADDLTIPLARLFDAGTVRVDRVLAVDPDAGRVELADGDLSYDYAAVCLGARTAFYDLPGVEDHATPLEGVEDARAIREGFLALDTGDRVVVGGAGLSGIQVAGELAELADDEGVEAEIVLVERLADVAPGFPPAFQAAVREELDARGVEVRVGRRIEGATPDTVELEDGSIPYDQLVWTGGIRGPDALSGTRASVRGTLRYGDGTFVVGDAARVVDRNGERVPASAQAAIREARTAATNIRRLVEHDLGGGDVFDPRLEALDFDPRGWVVSVGDGAVAQLGPTVLRGSAGRAIKATLGVGYRTSVGAVSEAVELAREEVAGALDRDDQQDEGG